MENPDIPDRYTHPEAKWRMGRGRPHLKRVQRTKRPTDSPQQPRICCGMTSRATDIDAMLTHSAAGEQQTHIPCGTINKTRGRADEGVSKIDSGFFISQKLPKIIPKFFIIVNN